MERAQIERDLQLDFNPVASPAQDPTIPRRETDGWVADLHLHSRHAGGVSPTMTLDLLASRGQSKGLDLMGTGDCLHAQWSRTLQAYLEPDDGGLFRPSGRLVSASRLDLPRLLWRELLFLLTCEVNCAPPGTPSGQGIHLLLFFRSFAAVQKLRQRLEPVADFSDGRPTLRLSPRELLERVSALGPECGLAVAHVWNPFFGLLGSRDGHNSLSELFGTMADRLLGVEMGLISTPAMCRRFSGLDLQPLFACSDAHSPDNLGRECTIVHAPRDFNAILGALRSPALVKVEKYPFQRTRYYLNYCSRCAKPFPTQICPQCQARLAIGARDRIAQLADRPAELTGPAAASWRIRLPLLDLIAREMGIGRKSASVQRRYWALLAAVGNERWVLEEAKYETLAPHATPALARAILAQRGNCGFSMDVSFGPEAEG